MLKKTVLTFAFLTILTTFYGFNAQFSAPATNSALNDETVMDYSLLPEGSYLISAYDNLIRNITSRSGARGLMQIMPSVARQFDVPVTEVSNPETNVWLANKLLSKIMSTLSLPEGISEKDRMSIVLASYNSGIGHVSDARRLAKLNGRYLSLKADPAYYESEVVKCGRFTGSRQTLAYVNDVIGRYDRYCRVAGR